MTEPSDRYPGFFWPLVIAAAAAILLMEWWLSGTAFVWPFWVRFLPGVVMPAIAAILLVRIAHPPIAAVSVAVPLALILLLTTAVAGGLTWLVVYVGMIGFFLWFTSSARAVAWWYRVILQARIRPPHVT